MRANALLRCLLLMAGGLLATYSPAQPAAPEPSFDVLEFSVEGNSVLATERIERSVYPFLGEKRTAADVEAARAALEQAYRSLGFGTVVVDIPEQRVTDGTVVLRVTEGVVSRLRVVGARWFSQERILREVPALAEGVVPNFADITTQLAAVNRSADRRVTPLLRPGRQPGTTEVDLNVEDRLPLSGSVELNNRHATDSTPTRLQASLRYDNLWQRGHGIGLQVQVSPENRDEVQVLSASYSIPDGVNVWALSWLDSTNNAISSLGSTTVASKGRVFGLRHIAVGPVGDGGFETTTLGAEFKDYLDQIGPTAPDNPALRLRYLPLSASYSRGWTVDGVRWQAGGGLTFAMNGVLGSEKQFDDKRALSRPTFALLKFDLAREQPLPLGMQLAASIEGQIADSPLVSNEQFSAGGVDSVRGYLESAAVGDQGLRASLELRSPDFAARDWTHVTSLRAHLFAEGAGLFLIDPLAGQQRRFWLAAAGAGLRLKTARYGSLSLDVGWPLRDLGTARARDVQIHASGVFPF